MHTLNLALQGGGSHGAFTWGALDALLADRRIAFEGLSGASAGAVNAVVLASGWARALATDEDPREAARAALARLWQQIGQWGALGTLQRRWAALLWGGLPAELAPAHVFGAGWRSLVSPYQANPLGVNPLRDLLERDVDFRAIARGPLKVFVSATHVTTGKAVIFGGEQLDARAVLASACLPMLFQAVEIDGQAYWDGGFSANPALAPLIHHCGSADVALIQINPLRRETVPRTAAEIMDRVNELTFNASLLTQMRAIDFVNRLVAEDALPQARCKTVRLHRIDGGAALPYPSSSRATADADMIDALFRLGQDAARAWLARHVDAIGVRGTVDLQADYLDDTRLALPVPAGTGAPRGFRPWLQRLLGRR